MTALKKPESDGLELSSHSLYQQDFQNLYAIAKARIVREGDLPSSTVQQRLDIFDKMSSFPLGRFLIQNGGLDGYWNDYIIRGGNEGDVRSELEEFILQEAPLVLATRECYSIFQKILQNQLENSICIASVPCGVMSEILTLDYSNLQKARIIGIDLDFESIMHANNLAEKKGLSTVTEYRQVDAWALGLSNVCHLLVSNGLNIYEPSYKRQIALYENFYEAITPGGMLLTSFLTPPPTQSPNSPWKMDLINEDHLALEQVITGNIIRPKWENYKTIDEISEQLIQVGFENIQCIYDSRGMRPSVVAFKPEA